MEGINNLPQYPNAWAAHKKKRKKELETQKKGESKEQTSIQKYKIM